MTVTADPILYLGLDIATERDTTALAGVYYNPDTDLYCLFGNYIWEPPVNIPVQVLPFIEHILMHYRVGRLAYDPYQFISEAQRLASGGYEHLLLKVNQQSENVLFSNILQDLINSRKFYGYRHVQRKNHYSWCVAQNTERGFVIKKRTQTKKIDAVIAEAMALYACVKDLQNHHHPSFKEETHARSVFALP